LQGIQNKEAGTVAEAQVVVALLQQGFGASWAIGDSVAWDLVSDYKGKVNRLQVKTTNVPASRGTWRIVCAHGAGNKEPYNKTQADACICVLPWAMYVIPVHKLDDIALRFWKPGEHPRYSTKRFSHCKYEWARERWDLLK